MLLKFEELGGSRLDSGASGKLVKTSRVIVARRGVERAGGRAFPFLLPCSWIHATPAKSEWATRSPRRASASWEMRRKGGRRTHLWFPKVTPAIDITKRNKEIATDRKSGTKNLVAERKPRVHTLSPSLPMKFRQFKSNGLRASTLPRQRVCGNIQVWEKQNNRYAQPTFP